MALNRVLSPILSRLPENNRLERIWKLAQVDFKRRYYDSGLGLVWALLNPLFRVTIYFFVFTYIMERSRGGIDNFALYIFNGLLFWLFFVEGSMKGLNILKQKRYLIENIQFEKIDLYLSATLSVFMGFLFNVCAYLIISLTLGRVPIFIEILYFPILVINIFLLVLAVSVMLSTINIYIKDITHIWAMVTLAGFWATPIFFPIELYYKYKFILFVNPVAGIVINSRNCLLFGTSPDYILMLWDIVYTFFLLMMATFLFQKYNHKAAEKL